jgi:hypothetical protein
MILGHVPIHLGLEKLVIVSPAFLCLIHGRIGVLEQTLSGTVAFPVKVLPVFARSRAFQSNALRSQVKEQANKALRRSSRTTTTAFQAHAQWAPVTPLQAAREWLALPFPAAIGHSRDAEAYDNPTAQPGMGHHSQLAAEDAIFHF